MKYFFYHIGTETILLYTVTLLYNILIRKVDDFFVSDQVADTFAFASIFAYRCIHISLCSIFDCETDCDIYRENGFTSWWYTNQLLRKWIEDSKILKVNNCVKSTRCFGTCSSMITLASCAFKLCRSQVFLYCCTLYEAISQRSLQRF